MDPDRVVSTGTPDWVERHLNQDFPPRLPDKWDHTMPFSISRRERGLLVKVVAGVKRLDLPPYYLVEAPDTGFGRAYLAPDGSRHVGVSPYKHPDPPGTHDFEEAVRLAESYLDGTLPHGPLVERGPDR